MRRRRLLAALGIAAASLVAGTAATVGYGLATGFERAADAGRPPARDRALRRGVARDRRRARAGAAQRRRALLPPRERRNTFVRARGEATGKATLDFLLGGRRGYAVVEGRDLRAPGEVARRARAGDATGGSRPATRLTVGDGFRLRIVGHRARALERRLPAHGHAAGVRAAVRRRPGRRTSRSCGSPTRTARTSRSRRRARPRSASATSRSSRARASRCCSGRPPGS